MRVSMGFGHILKNMDISRTVLPWWTDMNFGLSYLRQTRGDFSIAGTCPGRTHLKRSHRSDFALSVPDDYVGIYFAFDLRRAAATPATAMANNANVPGSGTCTGATRWPPKPLSLK